MTPTFDTLDAAAGARARSQARKAAIGSFVGEYRALLPGAAN